LWSKDKDLEIGPEDPQGQGLYSRTTILEELQVIRPNSCSLLTVTMAM